MMINQIPIEAFILISHNVKKNEIIGKCHNILLVINNGTFNNILIFIINKMNAKLVRAIEKCMLILHKRKGKIYVINFIEKYFDYADVHFYMTAIKKDVNIVRKIVFI